MIRNEERGMVKNGVKYAHEIDNQRMSNIDITSIWQN